jgi:ribonucleotide monophosphatase NagD (HAD superfamily)
LHHLADHKLNTAAIAIRDMGATFIATNRDASSHYVPGQKWISGGAIVAAVVGATGVEPIVAGKPSQFLLRYECTHVLQTRLALRMHAWSMAGER